jgi:hypothetical protein
MEAWVQRPVEERQKEAEQRKGYITRPMNSFMLYRSAYAERTKAWCAQNNHQVVSSVSGASWPMEPPELREFYNNLAKIERHNHQLAHPNYKFSPAKPGTASRKRKGGDESDFGDGDGDWAVTNGVKDRTRVGRDASYPARSAPTLNSNDEPFALHSDPYQKVWETTMADGRIQQFQQNPHFSQRHAYPMYPTATAYYLATQQPAHHILQQGSMLDQTDLNFSSGLVGLPGSSFHELTEMRSTAPTPAAPIDPQLEPGLGNIPYLPYDPAGGSNHLQYASTYPSFPPPEQLSYEVPSIEEPIEEPQRSAVESEKEPEVEQPVHEEHKPRQDSWQQGLSEIPELEHPSEFDPFLGDHEAQGSSHEELDHDGKELADELAKELDADDSDRTDVKSPRTT